MPVLKTVFCITDKMGPRRSLWVKTRLAGLARASYASRRLADLRDHRLTLVPRVDVGLLSGRTRDRSRPG